MDSRPILPSDHLLTRSIQEIPGVLGLALPIVVGLTSSTLIGVVDTVMIAPLGTHALAAAGITTSWLIVMYSALYGLVSMVNIRMAQGVGAGDPETVASNFRHGRILALGSGVLASLLMIAIFPLSSLLQQPAGVIEALRPYWMVKSLVLIPYTITAVFRGLFNAIHRPWIATAIAMSGVLFNIPLNALLIHGLPGWQGLGLLGAGLASVLAQLLALGMAWAVWRRSASLAAFRQMVRFSADKLLQGLREGTPVALSYSGEGAAYALVGLMLSIFGPVALAAHQVVHTIAAILYMLPLGMGVAVGIRIGQAVGGSEWHRVRPIGLGAAAIILSWMGLVTGALLLWRHPLAEKLSSDHQVAAIAAAMFLATAFMQVADGLQTTFQGALRGLVDVRVPTVLSLGANWLIALPAAYGLGVWLGFGPSGVWMGYGLGLFAAALALKHRFWKQTA